MKVFMKKLIKNLLVIMFVRVVNFILINEVIIWMIMVMVILCFSKKGGD